MSRDRLEIIRERLKREDDNGCEFHEHAPGDVAWLLAEVERLQKHQSTRHVLIALLRELPATTVVFKSASGEVSTAAEMVVQLDGLGTEFSKRWASDLLRVCRDLLQRQAVR